MKKCPNCEAVVDAYSECPVCNHVLTDEPHCGAKIESYKINKWFCTYLIKKHLFSLLCTVFVLVLIFFSLNPLSFYKIISIFLIIFMWVETLFKNLIYRIFTFKYTDDYLESTQKIVIYMCGALAVIAAFL